MKQLVIGLVGTGFASGFHLAGWKQVPGVEVIVKGITSLEEEKAKAIASENNMRYYPSLEDMVKDADIGVIDACVPDYAHEKVAIAAAEAGKDVVVEKLLTGYFGTDAERKSGASIGFNLDMQMAFDEAMQSVARIQQAVTKHDVACMYAENWVYAPGIVKVAELLAQKRNKILYMHGEESHSGSHSSSYGKWVEHGSGATSGKLCHPIGPTLMLKYLEAKRLGTTISPVAVSAVSTHNWRAIPDYKKLVGDNIRTDYLDVEDGMYATITFSDGTVAVAVSNEYSVGGVMNTFRIDATNQRHEVSLAPDLNVRAYAVDTTTFGTGDNAPYLREKVGFRGGLQYAAADEHRQLGYPVEFEAFARHIAFNEPLISDLRLARDTVAICYGALVSAQKGKRVELNLN